MTASIVRGVISNDVGNINAAILFSNFGPYHVARIDALSNRLHSEGINLLAVQFSDKSDTYGWKTEIPQKATAITLIDKPPANRFDAIRIARSFASSLRENSVRVVFLPSYSPLPNLCCLIAAKLVGCRTILMTESWSGTDRASMLGRFAKRQLVKLFDAALVGGQPQREYVASYGLASDRIYIGYDVIDVDYFSESADRWTDSIDHPVDGLPTRYFLNLGRFVAKKNLSLLIEAYSHFVSLVKSCDENDGSKGPSKITSEGPLEFSLADSSVRNANSSAENEIPSLVLVGEGYCRSELEAFANSLGLKVRDGNRNTTKSAGAEVVFYPFQQRELTPLFFAKCEAFVLPSCFEEWGLVVNEAMACGAPVLVSNSVGCRSDLVEDGQNGYGFDSTDSTELASQMYKFFIDPALKKRLGDYGRMKIQEWRPERFGESGLRALKAALAQ